MFAYGIALLGGALLWLATARIGGKAEAWDSSLYWSATYPLSVVLAGCLGYWVPQKPWRWGLAVMAAQIVSLVLTDSGFGLLPLGLVLFAVLALPAMGFALIMAGIRLRRKNA